MSIEEKYRIMTYNVRIDWILIRGKASVKMIKIADDTYDGQFPSDHFPVIVDLILQ